MFSTLFLHLKLLPQSHRFFLHLVCLPGHLFFLSCSHSGYICSLIKHPSSWLNWGTQECSPTPAATCSPWLHPDSRVNWGMAIPKPRGFGSGQIPAHQHTQETSASGSVPLCCNGVPAGGSRWLGTRQPSRKRSGCRQDDTTHWLFPVHSHLSQVLLSGVYVLLP